MKLNIQQKNAYHAEGVCRIVEIKEHLIENDCREALLKHAPFKALGESDDYPSSVFADAYVSAIEAGDLKPVVFGMLYDDMVRQKQHNAIVRRLQSTNTISTTNNKPFKRKVDAEKFQIHYELEETHELKEVENGFELCLRPPAKIKAIQDKKNGIKSYEEIRSQAFIELGIEEKSNADGELDATDEQWEKIDALVHKLQQAQHSK